MESLEGQSRIHGPSKNQLPENGTWHTDLHTQKTTTMPPRLHDGVVYGPKTTESALQNDESWPASIAASTLRWMFHLKLGPLGHRRWMTGADLHADHARPFMYTYIYIYIFFFNIYIYVCRVYIYIYVCYCMYVHIYIYVDISLFVYLFVYLFIDIPRRTHTCVYIYIYIKVFTRKTAGVVGICRGNMATSYMGY